MSESAGPQVVPEVVDVVVVGAGLAGAAAALTVAEAGYTVVLLEKCELPGGSSVLSGGGLLLAGTPLQEREGVDDEPERLRADILAAGLGRNDPEVVDAYIVNQAEAARWLELCGVEWALLSDTPRPHRQHQTERGYLVPFLVHRLQAMAPYAVLTGTAARRLHTDPSGRVTEVEIEQAGSRHRITVRRGVVLASGGFARDPELLETFAPSWGDAVPMSGEGSTGDGLRMAWALGAGLRDMAWVSASFGASIAHYPDVTPRPGERPRLLFPNLAGAIVVNREGRRFVNESWNYKRISPVCRDQPDGVGIMVFDQQVMDRSEDKALPLNWRSGLDDGTVRSAPTLVGLAALLDIAPETLLGTVEAYNRYVADGADPDFGRPLAGLTALDQGPYYAFPCGNGLTTTYCGLRVDGRMRVLTVFGEPIPGLYAAGEVVGGFHGAGYLSGTALGKALVFGRTAGRQLATAAT